MKLLLAEDERELSRALVAILKHNNYSVDAVYNGEDALDYILNDAYDGVILDIMMPKMDGITVLKKVREQNNNVPVLMLTAKAEVDDRVTGLDSGADDYLTKPFATKELLARIRAMTRRKDETVLDCREFGNIRLDPTTYELSAPGGSVRLANKEYQMMEMLITNRNMLISSDKFMDRIWGYDSETESNVVWVYISYLRRKLASIGANVGIKAVRGVGYTIEEKK
ncbi:MAG: response regulator transcription factor [Clostridiales bacterium]|nr:response regulator transcription factor [Clostridiales bacterium]